MDISQNQTSQNQVAQNNQSQMRVSPRGTITYRCSRATALALPIPEGELRCTDKVVPKEFIEIMERLMDTVTGHCLRKGCGASKVLTPRSCRDCKLCRSGPELIGKDMERRYYVTASHMSKCQECKLCWRHKNPVPHPYNGEVHGFLVGTDESFHKPCCGTACYQTIMATLAAEGISFGDRRTKLSISSAHVKKCEVCHENPRRVEFDLAMVQIDDVAYPHPVVYGFTKRVCGEKCAIADTAFPFPADGRMYASVGEYHDAHVPVSTSSSSSGPIMISTPTPAPIVKKSTSLGGNPPIDWNVCGFRAQYQYYLGKPEIKYYPLVDYEGTFLYRELMLKTNLSIIPGSLLVRLPKKILPHEENTESSERDPEPIDMEI